MPDTILSLVPAETGWRALYSGEFPEDEEMTRVVAWALVENEDGERRIEGYVVDPNDQSRIVPAPDGGSEVANTFDRYGFKTDL